VTLRETSERRTLRAPVTCPFQDALALRLARDFTGKQREDLAAATAAWPHAELAAHVESLVATHLGVRPRRTLFVKKSVGVVFGLELVDGSSVVLKFFPPTLTLTQLHGVLRCLQQLERAHFPVTPSVSPPFVTAFETLGCFFAYASGEVRTGHEPNVRRELASRLAEFTSLVTAINPAELPAAPGHHAQLWPPSPRSYLRFDARRDLAWLDTIAAQAQGVLEASTLPELPAHMDWGTKNARFVGDRVAALFDWDSLCRASEAEMVGRAAAQFTAQWDVPAAVVPSAVEAQSFVEDYEDAAGRRFSPEEWPVLIAAAQYVTATIARVEAAHPAPPRDGFLDRLRSLNGSPLLTGGPAREAP